MYTWYSTEPAQWWHVTAKWWKNKKFKSKNHLQNDNNKVLNMAYSCMLWLVFSPSPSLCSSPCAVLPAPIFGALASSTSFCECFTRLSSSPGHLQILFFGFFCCFFFTWKAGIHYASPLFPLRRSLSRIISLIFFLKNAYFFMEIPLSQKAKL